MKRDQAACAGMDPGQPADPSGHVASRAIDSPRSHFEVATRGRLGPVSSDADGLQAGFDALYLDLFVRAQRCARQLLGDRDMAEEIAAETLARAFARWSKVASYAEAWVTRVAINLALDTLRRKRLPVIAPSSQREGTLDGVLLRDQLRKLPRRQREVIVLRYLLDLDQNETAQVLGLRISTVSTHTKRGLARMRADLSDLRFGEDRP